MFKGMDGFDRFDDDDCLPILPQNHTLPIQIPYQFPPISPPLHSVSNLLEQIILNK